MERERFLKFRDELTAIDPNKMLPIAKSVFARNTSGFSENIEKLRDFIGGIPDDETKEIRNHTREHLFRLLLLPALGYEINRYVKDRLEADPAREDEYEFEVLLINIKKFTGESRLANKKARDTIPTIKDFTDNLKKCSLKNLKFAFAAYHWFREKAPKAKYAKAIDEALFGFNTSLDQILGIKPAYHTLTRQDVQKRLDELEQPFFGRDGDLGKLNQFVEERECGLMIVSAPAGTGKSALLAKWCDQRLNENDLVAYHFISNKYPATTRTIDILGNLLEQIWRLQEDKTADIPKDEKSLGDALFNALMVSPKNDKKLIVILDGLDEAAQILEPFIRDTQLAKNIFVIVSARMEGKHYPRYLYEWNRCITSGLEGDTLPLKGMIENDVVKWLQGVIPDLHNTEADALASILRETTDGLPLFLSYVFADLRQKLPEITTREQRVEFVKNLPAPFSEYLWEQLRSIKNADWTDKIRPLFATLSILKGPISKIELEAFLGKQFLELSDMDHSVTRWLWVNGGNWSFAHPRLALTFAQVIGLDHYPVSSQLDEKSFFARKTEKALIKWMQDIWNPDTRPDIEPEEKQYTLDWLPEHLVGLGKQGQQQAALLIANPAFLDERLRSDPRQAAARLAKNCDLWASLPFEAKAFDGGKQWTAFWAENESRLKRISLYRYPHVFSFADVVRNCLGDAAITGSGIAPSQIALKAQASNYRGLVRSIDVVHPKYTREICNVKASANGYISWTDTGAVQLWDMQGKLIENSELVTYSGRICGIWVLESGYISWENSGVIQLWDKNGYARKDCKLEAHKGGVNGVRPTENGYVSWGADGVIRFSNCLGQTIGGEDPAHNGGVNGVLPIEGGYVSWGTDGIIRFWNQQGNAMRSSDLKTYMSYVANVLPIKDGYISWGGGGAICFLDKNGKITGGGSPQAHLNFVGDVLPIKDGYISWGGDVGIRFWDKNGKIRKGPEREVYQERVQGFLPTEDGYVSWYMDGVIQFSNCQGDIIRAHRGCVYGVRPIEGGYVSWGRDGAIYFWDKQGRATKGGDPQAHLGAVLGVLSSGDSYISWGEDGAIRFWRKQGKAIESSGLQTHHNYITGILSTERGYISWGRKSGAICFWDKDGKATKGGDPQAHQGCVEGVLPINDGYISWERDGDIRFWDKYGAATRNNDVKTIHGCGDVLGVLPIGDSYISWGQYGPIRFWDKNWRVIEGGDFDVPQEYIRGVLPIREGYIRWGKKDGAIRFWNEQRQTIESNDLLKCLYGINGILPAGHGYVSWRKGGVTHFWDQYGQIIVGATSEVQRGYFKGVLPTVSGYISWGTCGTVWFWDQQGNIVRSSDSEFYQKNAKGVLSTADGYVSWGEDGAIHFWDGEGQPTRSADSKAHYDVNEVLPTGSGYVSWGHNAIRFWDKTGLPTTGGDPEPHYIVHGVIPVKDGFISWGDDSAIRLWDKQGNLLNILVPPGGILSVHITDSELIVLNRHFWIYPLVNFWRERIVTFG